MFILDTILIGGLRFVFDKIATAVDTELNDEAHLNEQLLAAGMRYELGEISEDDYDALYSDITGRLRVIREERRGAPSLSSGEYKVTGIDATFEGDEHN